MHSPSHDEDNDSFEYDHEGPEHDESYENADESLDDDYESLDADDESLEADDESLEADESLGADDESLGADDESLEADDESLEADDESLDDDYESLGADDESLEADDESLGADDASLGADVLAPPSLGPSIDQRSRGARGRARARAKALARQRAIARRARASQQQLGRRLADITRPLQGPGGLVRPRRLHPATGSSVVMVTRPDGRRTRVTISPTLASVDFLNQIRSGSATNHERMTKALANDTHAIRQLRITQAAAFKKLTDQQLAFDRMVTKRLVDGDAKLNERLAKELTTVNREHAAHDRGATKALAHQQRRALWNNLLLASGLPFFAAFGDVGDPFSRDNLLLTGSLAGWMVGDEIIERFIRGRDRPHGKHSKAAKQRMQAWKRGAKLWSYIAPAGNAATAWFLLEDQQHERFVSGVTTVSYASGLVSGNRVEIPVAEGYRSDFAKLSGVRAVTTIVSPGPAHVVGIRAVVEDGTLVLTPVFRTKIASAISFDVAWIVDTRAPNA